MPTLLSTLAPALLLQGEAGTASALGAGGPNLTRYLLVCGGLVVALGLLGFGLQRVVGGAWRARATRRSMRVVDVLPLAGRQRVAVVSCYDRTFVLGVGEKEVSLVAELDTEEVRAAEELEQQPKVDTARLGKAEFEKLLAAIPRKKKAGARATKRGSGRSRLGRGEGVVG